MQHHPVKALCKLLWDKNKSNGILSYTLSRVFVPGWKSILKTKAVIDKKCFCYNGIS